MTYWNRRFRSDQEINLD